MTPQPTFFRSAAEFRRWLRKNHASVPELWIGFWKLASGRRGLTYPQAVEEALCFGWIDGLKKGHDEHAFKQRFTPRRPKSIWSAINVRKVQALRKAGRMAKAGLDAFALRNPARRAPYSFENRDVVLPPEFLARFRRAAKAWAFFEAQPPGYRRVAAHYVMSAKREETRLRRFERLVDDSAAGRRLAVIAGPARQDAKAR